METVPSHLHFPLTKHLHGPGPNLVKVLFFRNRKLCWAKCKQNSNLNHPELDLKSPDQAGFSIGWHCVNYPAPHQLTPTPMPHSFTKLRMKINLNHFRNKVSFYTPRPLASESSQETWRYKQTFHSEILRGTPWHCPGPRIHSPVMRDFPHS